MIKKPNLFLVGAEKSGTTFLYKYLKQHKDIFFPIIKEPQFFSKDILPQYKEEKKLWNLHPSQWNYNKHIAYIRDINLYLKLYTEASNEKYLGDASVSYLFSKIAAKEIYKFNPKSKIIVILRHPVERAFSAYKMDMTIGRISKSFEEAIKEVSRYIERSLYYEQVKRYLETFPKENVLILLFDDLKKNPRYVINEIFSFLSLEPIQFEGFDKKNESYQPNILFLNNLLYRSGLKFLISRYTPPKIKETLKKIYYKKNFSYSLNKKTYNELLDIFEEDIKKLSKLIDKDLSSWLKRK